MLTYLDRLNLSIAGKYIQDEFDFSTPAMGWILSAFLLSYALCQIPGGWACDRFGARNVLTVAILWWSTFTAMTAIAPHVPVARWVGLAWSFAVIRFLVGLGEAPSSPSYTKVVSSWMGTARRGVGSSFNILGIGAGGALTTVFIAWVMQHWGWRMSFYLSGALGAIVAIVWHFYATDQPEKHAGVNTAELELIRSGVQVHRASESDPPPMHPPWGRMLSSKSVWGLILGYFCQGYAIYFFHTWFYIYLVRVHGFTVMQGGFWGSAPYLAIAVLAPFGGWFSDLAVAKFGKRRGRQVAVWLGMSCSAAQLWTGGQAENRTVSILLLAGAAGFNMFAATTFWATCIDLTENYSGSLSGLMNMCGNLGGWLSPIVTAYIATRFGWAPALELAAAVTLTSAFVWFFVNANHNLDEVPG